MNSKEFYVKQAANWFDQRQEWLEFLQLGAIKEDIKNVWLKCATFKLREACSVSPSPGWKFEQWGNPLDTWWFLKDFGPHSVGIGFGWGYQLYLGDWHGKINTQALSERMNSADYQVLRKTFGRVDIENAENRVNWMQKGDFYFGESSDGDIQIEELAWHAGHNTEKFVMQAKAKIEAFTQDEQMTYLLMKLNEEVRERLPSKRC